MFCSAEQRLIAHLQFYISALKKKERKENLFEGKGHKVDFNTLEHKVKAASLSSYEGNSLSNYFA